MCLVIPCLILLFPFCGYGQIDNNSLFPNSTSSDILLGDYMFFDVNHSVTLREESVIYYCNPSPHNIFNPSPCNNGQNYYFKTELIPAFGATIMFGGKFYFGDNQRFRFGMQVTGVILDFSFSTNSGFIYQLSPAALGFSSVYKVKDHSLIELNLNTGLNFRILPFLSSLTTLKVFTNVKYCIKRCSIGLDFAFNVHSLYGFIDLTYSLVFGYKLYRF
ncbi:MAG: hypothetical protein MK207_08355 [Saprospiraceae bacterium]|nr:hypothetical protein [Saprospiraceae bacterium]